MAKQRSIIKLEGTIGDISFYKTQDGYLAREKTALSADRIANDPNFQRTRENGAEFGRAGIAGKTLRRAFKELIQLSNDNRMVSRLTREMIRVIQADAVNVRGLRNVLDGELELLRGFNFNIRAVLDTVVFMSPQYQVDRVSGSFQMNIPAFDPKASIRVPAGASHFQLVTGAAIIDFENQTAETGTKRTDYLAVTDESPAASLEMVLSANSTHPLLMAAGIVFYQNVNNVYYPLSNGAYNALALMEIDGI